MVPPLGFYPLMVAEVNNRWQDRKNGKAYDATMRFLQEGSEKIKP